MSDRHTCHVKIIADKITFPDPDGSGKVNAVKGEIRLMAREDAKPFEVEGHVRILTEAEAAAEGLI